MQLLIVQRPASTSIRLYIISWNILASNEAILPVLDQQTSIFDELSHVLSSSPTYQRLNGLAASQQALDVDTYLCIGRPHRLSPGSIENDVGESRPVRDLILVSNKHKESPSELKHLSYDGHRLNDKRTNSSPRVPGSQNKHGICEPIRTEPGPLRSRDLPLSSLVRTQSLYS